MALVEFQDVWVRTAADAERPRLTEVAPTVFEERLQAVVLQERHGARAVAIWMGSADAFSLLRHDRGIGEIRPVASSVMAALLDATGARVEHVEITDVRENVCHSVIQLRIDRRVARVDARPSDALNLAVRVGAPILVADDVMSELACPIAEVSQHLEQCQQRSNHSLERGGWRPLSPELINDLRTSTAA